MKKIVLAFSALALFAFVDAKPSAAYYEGAWCAKISIGGGSVSERCDFMRFEACRRYITGQSTGMCVQNPRFAPTHYYVR